MEKEQLKNAIRLAKDERREPKDDRQSKKDKKDVFDIALERKRVIESREETCRKREEKEAEHEKNMKNPIYRESNQSETIRKDRKVERRARSQQERFQLIQKLTNATLSCPICRKVKTNSSSWIISKDKTKVVCRSCFSVYGWNFSHKFLDLSKIKLFEEKEYRYKISPLDLCRMRQNLGISVEQFVSGKFAVGWSATYQYQLEEGKFSTVSEKTMKKICWAFSCRGFPIELDIWGTPEIFYPIKGSLIRTVRKLVGISMRNFSEKAGWHYSYQSHLETGKVRIVSKITAETIQKILYSSL